MGRSKKPSKAAAAIRENAKLDHDTSIPLLSTLQQTSGTASYQEKRIYALSLWHSFLEGNHMSISNCPTVELFHSFILTSIKRAIKPINAPPELDTNNESQKVSLRYIKQIASTIQRHLTFTFAEWRYSDRDKLHLNEIYHQHLVSNFATLSRKTAKEYIGTEATRLLIIALLRQEHTNIPGMLWDQTLYQALAIALLNAISSRGGAIVCSGGYTGMECLVWDDIQLYFQATPHPRTVEDIYASVNLLWEKGKKSHAELQYNEDFISRQPAIIQPFLRRTRSSIEQRPKIFFQLTNPDDFILCIVKLLLAVAIGGGITKHTSLREIISSDDTMVEFKPEFRFFPVIPAVIKLKGGSMAEPATLGNLNDVIENARELAGIQNHITSRSFRYGTTREQSAISSTIMQVATASAAKEIGHSSKTFEWGLTDQYHGPSVADTYSSRVASSKTTTDLILTNGLKVNTTPQLILAGQKRAADEAFLHSPPLKTRAALQPRDNNQTLNTSAPNTYQSSNTIPPSMPKLTTSSTLPSAPNNIALQPSSSLLLTSPNESRPSIFQEVITGTLSDKHFEFINPTQILTTIRATLQNLGKLPTSPNAEAFIIACAQKRKRPVTIDPTTCLYIKITCRSTKNWNHPSVTKEQKELARISSNAQAAAAARRRKDAKLAKEEQERSSIENTIKELAAHQKP